MDWRPPGWKHLPKRGLDKWLDDTFLSFSEVMVLTIPVSLALVMVSDPGATLAAIATALALTLALTLVRSGRTRLSEHWPRFRPSAILARVVWYNGTLALTAAVGAFFDTSPLGSLASIGFAVAVSVGAVRTLPWAASRANAALSWWTWGRPHR